MPSADPAADGARLWEWLFADPALRAQWAEVRGQCPQRRVRLRIDADAPELHALPWELLRDPETRSDLAASSATPFSRYLAGRWLPGSPILQRPIRVLVAIATPANLGEYGLAPLDVAAEWASLQAATAEVPDVELTLLPQPCTLAAIEAALRDGHHVLHLIAHGAYSETRGEAVLFLADEHNRVARVSGDALAGMLARQLADTDVRREEKLRLVFLASCQSATRSPADAFRGIAPALVRAGVPAVLAMQDLVPIPTAQSFARTFYERLLQHGQVDLASNEARATLLTKQLPGAAIPVLFMRLRNGLLFGTRGQILGDRAESFWELLLANIADGECTPFLGPGVTRDLLPSPQEVAARLAQEYSYPFLHRDNLLHVGQFIGTMDNRRLRKQALLCLVEGYRARHGLPQDKRDRQRTLTEVVEASQWSERAREQFESEIHHQLAELDLPLYLTTNVDPFMTRALAADAEKQPRRLTIPWRETLSKEASRPHYDLDPPPSPEEPVVLHLFGTDDDLLSMVLTQDDYLNYLTGLARNYEHLLPTSVQASLASTTLLFLGYQLEDLDLKIIMRGLLTNLDLERWGMLHVAVQLDATANPAAQQEVTRYFQKYFANSKIDVYWGSTHQFVADLHGRWVEQDWQD